MSIIINNKIAPLEGTFYVSGDKSISHRALILASQTIGISKITNLSTATSIRYTIRALQQLGVEVTKTDMDTYQVNGVGVGGLTAPNNVLYMKNSATAARLFSGLLASYPFQTLISGDDSLIKRSMLRIIQPLTTMGVRFFGNSLPFILQGSLDLFPIEYTLPIPSAQVKSALLLAALNTAGRSIIIEPHKCRDHTEIMLKYLNANITVTENKCNTVIELVGRSELLAKDISIPGDSSSAAFLVAAALLIPHSNIVIPQVCVNPTRMGFYNAVHKMNGKVTLCNNRIVCGEKVADLIAEYSDDLRAIELPTTAAPSTIDEYPILSILAAKAKGITRMYGIEELAYKESNRLHAICTNLTACGIKAIVEKNELIIYGQESILGGSKINTYTDHRIAMAFIICGLITEKPLVFNTLTNIKDSFREFLNIMHTIKAFI